MNLLITGAASGIGAATARRMAAKGFHVVIADRNGPGAAALAAELVTAGHKATAVEVDVASSAAVKALMAQIAKDVGPVHLLFNNAGVTLRDRVEDICEADWDRVINIHVKGMFLVAQAVVPQMIERNGGAVVNTASDFSVIGVANAGAYCAAKSAVYSLTKAMAVELTPLGVRVNAIGPGPIDTPILRSGRAGAEVETALQRNRDRVPMKRLGRPEEVAAVVDFLLSDRASYIAGQLVHPNGGALSW